MLDFVTECISWLIGPGASEITEHMARWPAISLTAACCANRIWLRHPTLGRPVYPNLYILIIAPPFTYKSWCCDEVYRLLEEIPNHRDFMEPVRGSTSGKGMTDILASKNSKTADGRTHDQIWLVQDELSLHLGIGVYAKQFLSALTAMYNGSTEGDNTRHHGIWKIPRGYTINWLGAGAEAGIKELITKEHLEGGFFSRCITVEEGPIRKHLWRIRPPDTQEAALKDYIVDEIFPRAGEVPITPEAYEWMKTWYEAQPPPEADDYMSGRNFQQILKCCIVSVVSRRADAVGVYDCERALAWLADSRGVPAFIAATPAGREYLHSRSAKADILNTIRREGFIDRTGISDIAHRLHIPISVIDDWLDEWLDTHKIRAEVTKPTLGAGGRPRTDYVWNER